MAEKELRELQAKAMLALKAMFAASLNPVTVQQVHPAQMAMASAMHTACWQALQLIDVDGAPEDPKAFSLYLVDRLQHFLGQRKLDKDALWNLRTKLFDMCELISVLVMELRVNGEKGGPSA